MLILTLVNASFASQSLLTMARERIKSQVDDSVASIELYLAERQTDARVIASLPGTINVLNSQEDSAAQREAIAVIRLIRDIYGFSAISILDEQGEIVMSTDQQLVSENLAARPEIQEALSGNIAISDPATDPGMQTVWTHITAPVYNEEFIVIGVVDIRLVFDRIVSMIGFDTDRGGEGSYGVLLDKHLVRIAHPAHPEFQFRPVVPLSAQEKAQMIENNRFGAETAALLAANTSLSQVADAVAQLQSMQTREVFLRGITGSTGEASETMIKQFTLTDWYYMYRVPAASFNGIVNRLNQNALLVMVGAGLVSMLAMVLFSRYTIGRPLIHLVDVAHAIEDGDLSRRPALKRQDEIGQLASSFTSMAEKLEHRIHQEQEAQEKAMHLQEIEMNNRQKLEYAVAEYLTFVRKVADGNLNQRIQVNSDGVLGELGQEMNHMVDSLRMMTTQIQQASTNIAAVATSILSATTQQAASATQQSSAITQATTTVDEVKSIAQQTAQRSGQVAQTSQQMLSVAQEGTGVVEDTVESMLLIRERVERIAQTILSLSEQTQMIGSITTTVSELADQSNMLALNAAIEAARAGEQGKSFAVVAQQVRELAERSKAATVQVQEILGEIQQATNTAVMVTEEGTKGVEKGTGFSRRAGEVIHQIATEVEQGAQANMHMVHEAQQQTKGIEQIGQSMHAIQHATTQALASTRQAEQAAKDLNMLAQSLQEAIAVYEL